MSWLRVFASVVASAIGLAFWWALTEPLPVPPVILLGVAGAILFCAGLIAGNGGVIAAPVALLFSLFVGSIIATQLHQAFLPQTAPVEEFNRLISLRVPEVLPPLLIAVVIGAAGGWLGERLLPSRPRDLPTRR
jgi:Na+/melibiose symporter-like transporter